MENGNAQRATVQVALVPTGQLFLPDKWILAGASLTTKTLYPDYSFYVYHEASRQSLMFDLGIRKATYPKCIRDEFVLTEPRVPKSAAELLEAAQIPPDSINYIVYSHLHFDHIGNPGEFPQSQVVVGPGTKAATFPGFPTDPNSGFLGSVLEHPSVRELSYETDEWTSFGPFSKAFDFFGDGSFLLLDAPGHMPGHMMGLARTAQDEYVVMGGDCCHHRKIYTGEGGVGEGHGPNGAYSMHKDLETAKATIGKLHELSLRDDVLVCLAHDGYLEPTLKLLPENINGWRMAGVKGQIINVMAEVRVESKPLLAK
ncbi:hypothetical protein PV04_10661 [Phialophora macrospora]|uniref:Metallo-beta-lactamase domain-containing protein n=1 Tax=Phialophora macrospora TaxID=1851006 RepID=A0A0D2F3N2_9EURO|nr:hypothetical protein PV04_10661 [Phialophora macrospora]